MREKGRNFPIIAKFDRLLAPKKQKQKKLTGYYLSDTTDLRVYPFAMNAVIGASAIHLRNKKDEILDRGRGGENKNRGDDPNTSFFRLQLEPKTASSSTQQQPARANAATRWRDRGVERMGHAWR